MILQVYVRDDETGLLDGEFRDGDVLQTLNDGHVPGGIEAKTFLFIQVPDPPNAQAVEENLVKPEPMPGGDPQDMRHARRYGLNWRAKFTALEVATIEDQTTTLAEGPLVSGGTVTNGVVMDKFVFTDFHRK